MRVFVTGGTGSIGRRVVRRLLDRGDQAVVLTRRQNEAWRLPELRGAEVVPGDPSSEEGWARHVDGCDAVLNLVGHNVFGKRWDSEVKRQIRDSRVYAAQHVVAAIRQARKPPATLVQASAIGYYGPRGDEVLTEASPPGADFLATVCREWEDAALPAEDLGTRLVRLRIGVVLARGEGALGIMTPIFRWGGAAPVGGGGNPLRPGRGPQWMSWIHVEDLVELALLALDDQGARGPINGTAPHPERNADFARALAHALRRPFLPIGPPDVVLRVILGEVADVIGKGQRVLPERALALGYAFHFPDLAGALADLFTRKRPDASGAVAPAAQGPH